MVDQMPAVPRSVPLQRPRARLGGFTAIAQSAWMGFALASDVLEHLYLAPAAVLRRGRGIVPRLPRSLSLKGLLVREFSVAEASFILMASFFMSAMLGAVRQVLFNSQFGVSAVANAYYAAFRLPDTLFSLVAGGALSSALIPILLNARRSDGEEAGWRLVSGVLTLLLVVFAVLILVIEISAPLLVSRVLAPGFDTETSALAVTLTRIMLVQPLILLLGSMATAVLNSRNRFLLTGLSVVSHNVSLIAGILLARAVPGLGIYGPTLGVIGGAILQALILLPGLRDAGGRLHALWEPADRRLREVMRLLVPNGLSVGVNYAGFILDTSFATRAPEAAGLAAIYNAWLIAGLPIALLGQAVGQAAFPRLAASADAGNWQGLRALTVRTLAIAVGLALPALAALVLLGRSAIRVLFEHGEYSAAAGDLTYRVLVAYAVALPAYIATEVITRGLIALRDTRTPLITNSGQILLRAILLSVLLGRLGAVAIPAAFAISASLETLALGVALALRLRRAPRSAAVEPGPEETGSVSNVEAKEY